MDTIAAGEAMIAQTYKAIRNSPLWDTSLLIITYDEHGGFYDHSETPRPAPPPGDGNPYGYNKFGFDFSSYGVRVPAVIVSPLIAKGTVDPTLYDHTSIARTVEDLYGLTNLTDRDGSAASLINLLDFNSPPRTDCPTSIDVPAPAPRSDAPPIDQAADFSDPTPLKATGNTMGFLHIAAKTDIELQGGTDAAKAAVLARVQAIKTNGQARAYFAEVGTKLQAAKADENEKAGPCKTGTRTTSSILRVYYSTTSVILCGDRFRLFWPAAMLTCELQMAKPSFVFVTPKR
jgi:phospholipase C